MTICKNYQDRLEELKAASNSYDKDKLFQNIIDDAWNDFQNSWISYEERTEIYFAATSIKNE
jgi:hypothetical protein